MTPKRSVAFIVAAVLVTMASTAMAQSKDPLVGTWQMSAAKSKYTPGPAPKSGTSTIAAAGTGYKFTVHQVPMKGAPQDWSFTSGFDGKPSKVTGNNPSADTITVKRVDARTYDSVQTKNGKETQRQHVVVSADGKTRTVTTTGSDGAGMKINNVAVYDKK